MTKAPTPISSNWLHYTHSSIRDLAWLLFSPEVFSQALEGYPCFSWNLDITATHDWLCKLEKQMLSCTEKWPEIQRINYRRLGLYCESLFAFAIEHSEQFSHQPYSLLARNHQFFSDKTTVGAIDFIMESKSKEHSALYSHVELAVKFYLQQDRQSTAWKHWVGPNAADRLDLKMNRLLSHQLPLPEKQKLHEQFDAILETPNVSQKISSMHFIKGYMLCPADETGLTASKLEPPENANSDCLGGFWMRVSDFIKAVEQNSDFLASESKIWQCDKMDWLTGPDKTSQAISVEQSAKSLRDNFTEKKSDSYPPPPKFLLIENGVNQHIPLMIVSDYWPSTKPPSRKI